MGPNTCTSCMLDLNILNSVEYSNTAEAVIHSDVAQVVSKCHHHNSSLVSRPIRKLCNVRIAKVQTSYNKEKHGGKGSM